jgi:hypothetical protein
VDPITMGEVLAADKWGQSLDMRIFITFFL